MEPHGVKGLNGPFYLEGWSHSESELEFSFNHQAPSSRKSPGAPREPPSPPLVLAFPLSTTRGLHHRSQASASDSSSDEDQRLSSHDEPWIIEEWMILGGETQPGDGDIQLNLSYWGDTWAVTGKRKCGSSGPILRYFCAPQLSCSHCSKTGHSARICPSLKRRAACLLCGLLGHRQWSCPSRPCGDCGLPPHGTTRCPRRPLWDQHCLRCGMTGHLADPETRPTRRSVYCYNCSKSGHFGYVKLGDTCSLPPLSEHQHYGKRTKVGSKHYGPDQSGPGTRRRESPREGKKLKAERRREKQELKKLRQQTQARRGGGLHGRGRTGARGEEDPFRDHPNHHHQGVKVIGEPQTRKSREAERWKKRRGMRRGFPTETSEQQMKTGFHPRTHHRRR
ncbi:hypothetical protein NHX12_011398 [Muraenolepis orangiensis]|uniref:Zinc finger CCHC domain-containing protein 7 n=1 Tax=Muraenolepis orangiensis TaxID=630683 RepID=A0A9Q0I5N1_9TELE|nr:hypothetical protein NHX12_011398 [Muraenolepis orangiensis]